MGNQQSMPASDGDFPINQKRFSRIKTSTSSSPSPTRSLKKDGVQTSVTHLAIGGYWDSDSALASPSREAIPRPEAWQKARSPLNSPSEEAEYFDDQAVAAFNGRLGEALAENTPFHSAMSSTAQLPSEAQAMAAQNTANADLQTAIRLLEELRKTASPEDLVALHRALLPARSADPLSPTSETSIAGSAAAVMRKKSMAKPGLATRKIIKRRTTNKKDKNAQSTTVDTENLPWKPEMITTSPLDRLSSLDIDREVTVKWAPRAETPATLDYATLGNYQIGTLVVTNGMASPAPSVMSRSRTPMSPSLDTSSIPAMPPMGQSPVSPPVSTPDAKMLDSEPPLPPAHGQAPATLSPTVDVSQATPVQPTKPWMSSHNRSQSPLRNQWSAAAEQVEIVDGEDDDEDEEHILFRPSLAHQKRRSALSVLIGAERKEMEDTRTKIDITEDTMPLGHEGAISLASIYQADLPPSPFASTAEKSRESYAATDYHSVSSLGFEDDDMQHDDSVLHVEESRQAALNALEDNAPRSLQAYRDITPETALSSHPVPRPRSPVSPISPMEEDQPEFPVTVLKNADSGYSSGVSANGSAVIPQGPSEVSLARPTPESTSISRFSVDHPTVEEVGTARVVMLRSHTMPEGPKTLVTAQQVIPVAIEKQTPAPQTNFQEQALRKAATTPEAREARPVVKERTKSWRKSMRKSLPKLFSSEDLLNKQEKLIIQEAAPAKKLQKKRPTTPGAPSLADPHTSINYVPAVPNDVFSRFADRMAERKTQDALDRTYVHDANAGTHDGPALPGAPVSFPDNDIDLEARSGRSRTRQGSEEPPQPPRHRFGLSSRRSSRHRDALPQADPSKADRSRMPAPRSVSQHSIVQHTVPKDTAPANRALPTRADIGTVPTAPFVGGARLRDQMTGSAMNNGSRPTPTRPQSYYEGSFQPPPPATSAGAQDPRQLRRPRSLYGNMPAAAPPPRPRTAHQENTSPMRPRSRHGEPVPQMPPLSSMPAGRPPRPRSAHPREGERLPLHNAPPAQRVSAMPRRPFSMVSRPSNERVDTVESFGENQSRQPFMPSRSSSVYDELPSQRRRLSTRERNPSATNVPVLVNQAPVQERQDDNWPILQDPQKLDVEVGDEFVVDWAAESRRWRERKMQAESNVNEFGAAQVQPTSQSATVNSAPPASEPVQPLKLQRTTTAPVSSRSSVYEPVQSRPASVINRVAPANLSGQSSGTSTPDARITRTKSSPNHGSTTNRPVSILKTSPSKTNLELQDAPVLNTQQMNAASLRNALQPSISTVDVRSAPSSAYSTASSYLPSEGRNIPAVAKYAEEGIFGRYGGGFRHSRVDFSRPAEDKPARPRSILNRSRNNSSTSINRIPSDGKNGKNKWANDGADHGFDLVDVPVLSGSLSLVGTYDFR